MVCYGFNGFQWFGSRSQVILATKTQQFSKDNVSSTSTAAKAKWKFLFYHVSNNMENIRRYFMKQNLLTLGAQYFYRSAHICKRIKIALEQQQKNCWKLKRDRRKSKNCFMWKQRKDERFMPILNNPNVSLQQLFFNFKISLKSFYASLKTIKTWTIFF